MKEEKQEALKKLWSQAVVPGCGPRLWSQTVVPDCGPRAVVPDCGPELWSQTVVQSCGPSCSSRRRVPGCGPCSRRREARSRHRRAAVLDRTSTDDGVEVQINPSEMRDYRDHGDVAGPHTNAQAVPGPCTPLDQIWISGVEYSFSPEQRVCSEVVERVAPGLSGPLSLDTDPTLTLGSSSGADVAPCDVTGRRSG
uniref:Uncharacterized protein n=2 Tax=Knipowitschia caucasica TaxID=637954 RepID=A0AAV2KRG7_KNICA